MLIDRKGSLTRDDFIALGFENERLDNQSDTWTYAVPNIYIDKDEVYIGGKLNLILIGCEDDGCVYMYEIGSHRESPKWTSKASVKCLIELLKGD